MNTFNNVTIANDDGLQIRMSGHELNKIVQTIAQALPGSAKRLQLFKKDSERSEEGSNFSTKSALK